VSQTSRKKRLLNSLRGRKLTWLWNLGRAELKTTYLPQRYIFMVSNFQLAILTQFNENDGQTYRDIAQGTQLNETTLKPQLALLVKAKVLLQNGDDYDLNLSQCISSEICDDN
jgi:cullin 1